jgi:acetolactate decarboxylase
MNSLYVSAPVNALVEGLYEEKTSLEEMKTHGDFGIGTFNNLDGEMVMLDGEVYQLKADGTCNPVEDSVMTPFACVTFFKADTYDELEGDFDYKTFQDLLVRCTPSQNMLYAIRIDGTFSYVKTRSVPKQENYRPLVEVAREQPEFEYDNVKGTMVGFYNPPFISSINVPGYHLHFISDDHSKGGHLLECRMLSGRIGMQHLQRLELKLPVTFDYLTADFSRNIAKDLDEAEK